MVGNLGIDGQKDYTSPTISREEGVYVWRREDIAGLITSPIKSSYQHQHAQTSTWGEMSYFGLIGKHLCTYV